MWITLLSLLLLYSFTWLRGVSLAGAGALICLAALSVVGPTTLSVQTFTSVQPFPLLMLGGIILTRGILHQQSWLVLSGAVTCLLTAGFSLEETSLSAGKMTITAISTWLAVMTIGFVYQDQFAKALRKVGALMMGLAGVIAMLGPHAVEIPWSYRIAFVLGSAVLAFAIANVVKSRWYLCMSFSLLALCGYETAAIGFHAAQNFIGASTLAALMWSIGTLLIGILISSHKASWLPKRIIPNWTNGHSHKEA